MRKTHDDTYRYRTPRRMMCGADVSSAWQGNDAVDRRETAYQGRNCSPYRPILRQLRHTLWRGVIVPALPLGRTSPVVSTSRESRAVMARAARSGGRRRCKRFSSRRIGPTDGAPALPRQRDRTPRFGGERGGGEGDVVGDRRDDGRDEGGGRVR